LHLGARIYREELVSEYDRPHDRAGRSDTDATMIAGHRVALTAVTVAGAEVALYTVADLEERVDRGALLRGDAEPPYWAHLWTGARVLASYVSRFVDVRGRRVLDLGCGLGLPGIVAARAGGVVLFVDAAAAALELVAASARVNNVDGELCGDDFRALPPERRFDVILAAEVAYDPPTFDDLAATVARHLAPAGVAILSDGYRTDTHALYTALRRRGLVLHAVDVRPLEDGRPIAVRLTVATPAAL
jgi:predicted nicotinamide N-methyase